MGEEANTGDAPEDEASSSTKRFSGRRSWKSYFFLSFSLENFEIHGLD